MWVTKIVTYLCNCNTMLAGLAMAMSSVTVVGNSILLGRYKSRFTTTKPSREEIYASDEHKIAYSSQPATTTAT